jgi:hypothetical protein
MELDFFFQMKLWPSPYIGWDPGMWREERREALARQETKPTSHQERELASFWYRLKGKG